MESNGNIESLDVLRTKDIKGIVRLGGSVGSAEALNNNLKTKYGIRESHLEGNRYDEYLWGYYNLFVFSNLIKDEVYEHVVNGKSYEEVSNQFPNVSLNSYRTVVYKETLRIRDIISNNPNSVVKKKLEITNGMWELLEKLRERYPNVRQTGKGDFNLDIDFTKGKFDRGFNEKISESDFEGLVEILQFMSQNYRRIMQKNINPEYIGYVEMLLTKPDDDLTEEEFMRRRDLIDSLMLEI